MEKEQYLKKECDELKKIWPDNRRMTIVFHGHSIVCGYQEDKIVRPMEAYPQLVLKYLAERYPYGVVSTITTAIGGENSIEGAARFREDVLTHKPDIVCIDYARNDMMISAVDMEKAWSTMIEQALSDGCKVILVTPATDSKEIYYDPDKRLQSDEEMSTLIRQLASRYKVALADAALEFERLFEAGHKPAEYMASVNHPNKAGHEVIANEIMKLFM